MMNRGGLITLFTVFLGWSAAHAQLTNVGQRIFISGDALLVVQGTVKNSSGSFLNQGELRLSGDWINHDSEKAFAVGSTGKVTFNGKGQKIGGTRLTLFPSMVIDGIASLNINTEVQSLRLNGQLDLEDNTFLVSNPGADALSRTKGYINTDRGGRLIRNTNSQDLYSYPLGNATRFRPVVVIPSSSEPMTFSATMFNDDPTNKGFDIKSKRQDIKAVFDRYFYVINQDKGSANVGIRFFLNSAVSSPNTQSEGDIKQLLSWTNFRVWEKAAPSTVISGDFEDNLDRSLLFTSTGPIRNTAFTFGEATTAEDPLTFFNAFSPDGDGKNDTWTIRNIDLYPENDVTIFNRWGDAVFQTKSFSSTNTWDGGNNNAGTYYYVLNVKINGALKSYKGFITMLKKD